jgi:hypothetical protein
VNDLWIETRSYPKWPGEKAVLDQSIEACVFATLIVFLPEQ